MSAFMYSIFLCEKQIWNIGMSLFLEQKTKSNAVIEESSNFFKFLHPIVCQIDTISIS